MGVCAYESLGWSVKNERENGRNKIPLVEAGIPRWAE